jgi:hypothetical protein
MGCEICNNGEIQNEIQKKIWNIVKYYQLVKNLMWDEDLIKVVKPTASISEPPAITTNKISINLCMTNPLHLSQLSDSYLVYLLLPFHTIINFSMLPLGFLQLTIQHHAGFEVPVTMTMKGTIFWDVMSCSLVYSTELHGITSHKIELLIDRQLIIN